MNLSPKDLFALRSQIENSNKLIADGILDEGVHTLMNALLSLSQHGKGKVADNLAKLAVKGITAAVAQMPPEQQKEIIKHLLENSL